MIFFEDEFDKLQADIHDNAVNHGWYDSSPDDCKLIVMIHSELSECIEALRHGNPESERIPGYCHAVEELADAVIRIMDMAQAREWDLSGAILAKHEHNRGRRIKHGGKLF